MARIVADRVMETSSTTGTGTYALAGAVTGFQAFSAVCANNDTAAYYAEEVDANGVPSGGWEVGIGTWTTGNNLARTTILASSNAGAAVSWAAGTRRVALGWPAAVLPGTVIAPTPASDQNDYTPTGIAQAKQIRVTPSATIQITGLAAGYDGEVKYLVNAATDFAIILCRENSGSAAANRFTWPYGLPLFLMPGDAIVLVYDATASRWRLEDPARANPNVQFEYWDDFILSSDRYGTRNTGTGAATAAANAGNNTTERTIGNSQHSTGTTATGRAYATSGAVGNVVAPTMGPALFLTRVMVPTLSNGTQRYQVIAGFHDAPEGVNVTDGVYWKYDDAASANWERCAANGGARTETAGAKAVAANAYIWLGIFVNAGWTRADYFYSDDSVTWTIEGSVSTNLPVGTALVQPAEGINKTVGTTASILHADVLAHRYDFVRG